jgi:hypothetical protein
MQHSILTKEERSSEEVWEKTNNEAMQELFIITR